MSRGYIVVAEKPSVARAISWVLKDQPGIVVSSVRGHVCMVDLPFEFKTWTLTNLTHILDIQKLRSIISDHRSYYEIKKLFTQHAEKVLVVATDNDPEGDLIGNEILCIYQLVRGESAPYARIRFNSTAPHEIRAAWQKPEQQLNEGWVKKAKFRQMFDLLIGAAFTRLLTLGLQGRRVRVLVSFGSCQTPTLYFVVEREKEILNFRPVKYWVLKVLLETEKGEKFEVSTEHIDVINQAQQTYEKVRNAREGTVSGYHKEPRIIPRPYPLRTDDALRDLTKITGISASRLLSIMEFLYSVGTISYPRTDTNQYPQGFNFSQPRKAAEDAGILRGTLSVNAVAAPRDGKLNDGAHPPIYPVRAYVKQDLSRKIWEYVAKRFMANVYMNDAERMEQRVEVSIETVPFTASGGYMSKMEFFSIYAYFRPADKRLPELSLGEKVRVLRVDFVEEETKPPPRLTEAELLRRMEKEGIGTDATRSSFPTLIVNRGYAARVERAYKPTGLGMALIDSLLEVDSRLVTPQTRRLVEEKMRLIETGAIQFNDALNDSANIYKQLLEACKERIGGISEALARAVENMPVPEKPWVKRRTWKRRVKR